MTILYEILGILGLQVMDSNLDQFRNADKDRKSTQTEGGKKMANVERPIQTEHDPAENRVHTSACAEHKECHHVLT